MRNPPPASTEGSFSTPPKKALSAVGFLLCTITWAPVIMATAPSLAGAACYHGSVSLGWETVMRRIIAVIGVLALAGCSVMRSLTGEPPAYVVFFDSHDVTLTADARA